ncbi:MAG: hypothetical protein GXY07_19615 [Candidatus Hydrogenedentes bacterium]|nr:hypothetical protein [Candidatus Hydrogenedentota bacterium]
MEKIPSLMCINLSCPETEASVGIMPDGTPHQKPIEGTMYGSKGLITTDQVCEGPSKTRQRLESNAT